PTDQVAFRRSPGEAHTEQHQRIDAAVNRFLITRRGGVEQNLGVVYLRLLDSRHRMAEQDFKQRIRLFNIAGLVFAFEAFPMDVERELVVVLPYARREQALSKTKIIKRFAVCQGLADGAPGGQVAACELVSLRG